MKQLDELETMLEKERETIENQRRQVNIYFNLKIKLILIKVNRRAATIPHGAN